MTLPLATATGTATSATLRRSPDYPDPKPTDRPSIGPPDIAIPASRGLRLRLFVWLLANFPAYVRYIYNNSSLSKLHTLHELDFVEQRYFPLVTPLSTGRNDHPDEISYTNPARVGKSHATPAQRYWSVADYHAAYAGGKVTPSAVVETLLPLIRRDVPKPHLHARAFRHTDVDLTMRAARASDERWRNGKSLGVLDGVPIAIKDEADVEGFKRSDGGTQVSLGTFTMWCIQKWQDEGAIVIGISSMPEFGLDPSGRNHIHGLLPNPYSPVHCPGGSSAGSGYAIAEGIVPIALGADGGGSIRTPSAWCGVFGLKPSHARISLWPGVALANTTAVYGPMAANMADLEVAYRVMATPDPHVNIAASFPPPRKFDQPRNKVLGICKPWLDRAHPSVKESCQNAIDHLSHKMGYEVVDISIPYLTEGQMSHFMTLFSEVRATLSDVSELTLENQALLSILSACKTWDFMMAQKIRNVLMQHLAHLFEKYPGLVIVTPTVPDPPSLLDPVDEKYGISDLQSTAVRIIEYVWLANFSGTPSISFPVGYLDPVDGDGKLPVGMMGLGEWGSEDALIEFGYDGERYLHTGLQGGRQKPAGWIDSLDLARNS